MIVRNLKIREIFATTSVKTIEIELETDKADVRASVPVGTSRGKHEVKYLPTETVISQFAILRRTLRTSHFESQKELDSYLHSIDKSVSFREIGGNLALAISSAFLKGFAAESGMNLFEYIASIVPKKEKSPTRLDMPKPLCNVAGSSKSWERKDIQEFLLFPVHQDGFLSSAEKMVEAYKEIGKKLKETDKRFAYGKNIESAWVTSLSSENILRILKDVANDKMLKIGIDVAASMLWDGKGYAYDSGRMIRPEQVSFLSKLVEKYPISYIEDPFHEDDFIGFSLLTQRLGLKGKLICGDDLYATNMNRLLEGIKHKSTNAIIIKPNQVGTITDTINFAVEAQKHKWRTVMSHRSGETEDALICHLAVGLGCDYVKFGIGGDRTSKINEMIRIEETLKGSNL